MYSTDSQHHSISIECIGRSSITDQLAPVAPAWNSTRAVQHTTLWQQVASDEAWDIIASRRPW